MEIMIVGGGLGGISMALALAKYGLRSTLFEAASELREIGAGIQLGPNALHALDRLGVTAELLKEAVIVKNFDLMNADTGSRISQFDLGPAFRDRFGHPYCVVHRADLHITLLREAEESGMVTIKTNHRVCGYSRNGAKTVVHFHEQADVEGDVVIGADGLRSAIRQQMLQDGAPRVSGHSTYRSVIPIEEMPEDLRWPSMTIWVGNKIHIVHYPLKGWKAFNLVATVHEDNTVAVAGEPASQQHVLDVFGHVASEVRSAISAGRDWKRWVLCDRDPARSWVDGNVFLLGDAAHPTLQYLAQGACMAIEDSLFLAGLLATELPLSRIAHLYQRERQTRTARVQIGSRLIGDNVFHPGGAAAAARDEIFSAMSNTAFYDHMAWLYDYRVEKHVANLAPEVA